MSAERGVVAVKVWSVLVGMMLCAPSILCAAEPGVSEPPTTDRNLPPVVKIVGDHVIKREVDALPVTVALKGEATDDGKPNAQLSLKWKKISGDVTFQPDNAAQTTATIAKIGVTVVRLLANDGQYERGETVTILVSLKRTEPPQTDRNKPPVVKILGDRPIKLEVDALPVTVALKGEATDDGKVNAQLALKWVKISGDVTFQPDNAAQTTATITKAGTVVVRLLANDGQYERGETLTIIVHEKRTEPPTGGDHVPPVTINRPPKVEAGERQKLSADTLPVSVMLAGKVEDDGKPEGSVITLKWSKLVGPADVVFEPDNAASAKATFSKAGIYVLLLTANDGQLQGMDKLEIIVGGDLPPAAINKPPMVHAGESMTIKSDALPATATVNGKVEDDGKINPVTVKWTQLAGPATATIETPDKLESKVVLPKLGLYVLVLTANDGQFQRSAMLRLKVEPGAVSRNHPPEVDAGEKIAVSGKTLPVTAALKGKVTDDGLMKPLVLKWTQIAGPGDGTIESSDKAETNVSLPKIGTYVFVLTADDGEFTRHDYVVVRVEPDESGINHPPEVEAGENQSVPATAAPQTITLKGTVTDDGLAKPFTVKWMQITGPADAVIDAPDKLETTVKVGPAGNYVFTLTADDGEFQRFDHVTVHVGLPEAPKAGPEPRILDVR